MNRSVVALFATLASLAVILAVAVAGAMGGGRAPASHVGMRRHDHHRHDARQRPGRLPEQRDRDRRRRHHPRPERPPDRRRRHRVRGLPRERVLRRRGAERRPRRVTVKDGSTREFGFGVFVVGARDNRVLGISPRPRTSSSAPWSPSSSRSEVRNGSFSHNIPPEGDGIGLFGSRPHQDRGQLDQGQPRARHPRRRFHRQLDQGEPVLASSRGLIGAGDPDGGGPQRDARQPRRSKRRHPRRPRQPKRDRPQPRLPSSGGHLGSQGTPEPGRPQCGR